MKKITLGALIVAIVLFFSGVAIAELMIPAAEKAKERASVAVDKSPVISGDWAISNPGLEKIEFIHWKDGFAKPSCNKNGICEPELGENPSCADCKDGEDPTPTTSCYAFMGQYGKKLLKWNELPVSYAINSDGLSEIFVVGAITAGAEEWDVNTGKEIFNNSYTVSTGPEAAYKVQNYVNGISFDDYYIDPGIIGAANVWYSPATKEIVEFDIVFETDYAWGDCLGNEIECYNNEVMDLQNIAIHELGHAVGLADVYEAECNEVTMYGYSNNGETQKRTLESADITGIQMLY
ncbi:matrixin family metalloprotease [Patescibacteria group bacterium]